MEPVEVDGPSRPPRVNHAETVLPPGSSAGGAAAACSRLEVDGAVVGDLEHFEGAAQADEHGAAQREVEDLVVGEVRAQAREQLVVDVAMVGGEPFGVLDREALAVGVARLRRYSSRWW